MKKLFLSVLVFSCLYTVKAQKLASFSLTLPVQGYVSIGNKQVYTEANAQGVKQALDFLYSLRVDGRDTIKEFYNMSNKASVVPENLQGTQTGIAPISWDKDLFNKCETVADMKRMAGHITNHSFSFYAVIANNHAGIINYPCLIFQLASGKRGVMYITRADNDALLVKIKVEV